MNITSPHFSRSITAEIYKLKRTPLLWIALIGGIFVATFVFLIYVLNSKELIKIEGTPWKLYFKIGFIIISMLLLMPYVILVTSSIAYFEHNSNAWKYLYSLPIQKGNIYFSKLFLAIILIALTHIVFLITILVTGYLLDFIHPAYGFQKYNPSFSQFASLVGHSYLSVLGVVGFQYWLSIRWKNFITPIAIGLMGFVIGLFLLFVKKFDLAVYWPYAYSGIIGFEMSPEGEPTGMLQFGGLMLVEWLSLACFIIFALIGFYEEKNSNVK